MMRIARIASHEDLLHRVLERAGQLLERAREQGRHVRQLPVQRHGVRLQRAHVIALDLCTRERRLHGRSEARDVEADVVDAEGPPARALLRDPARGALAAAEEGVLLEEQREAVPNDRQHLRLRGGRPEVDQPLQLLSLLYSVVAKLAPQLRVLDSQVRNLRLQGAELRMPAQQLALHVHMRRL